MQRRSFMAGMLAACAAPMVVKAGILMPVKEIWITPTLHGMGANPLYAEFVANYTDNLSRAVRQMKANVQNLYSLDDMDRIVCGMPLRTWANPTLVHGKGRY